jgi:hypothetical protein
MSFIFYCCSTRIILFCRRKHYRLYKKLGEHTSLHYCGSHLDSVQQIYIDSIQSTINCMNYFPNITELIFKDMVCIPRASITIILNCIIPLKQLTKLVITCDHFPIQEVIKILCSISRIHTLILQSIACYQKDSDYMSIKENKNFQLVSNTNIIRNVTCSTQCTLEQIKLLLALCPKLRYLTINISDSSLEPITQFLLNKTNKKSRHLCSLCFSRIYNHWDERLDALIKSETLLDDYTLKQVYSELYLWW